MKRDQALIASSGGGDGCARVVVVVVIGATGAGAAGAVDPPPMVAPVLLGVYGGGDPIPQLLLPLSLSPRVTGYPQVAPYRYQG